MTKFVNRNNVAGVIFSVPKDAYLSVEAWLEAKAPDNSLVYDTPTQLLALGLTIVDARKVDGCYHRARFKVPFKTKIRVPAVKSHSKVIDISTVEGKVFPGLIFFDKSKNKTTNIGTSAPSKISKR